jgi:hypothetical protein
MLDKNVSRYDHFDVGYNHRGSIDISDTWERTYWVEDGTEYIMTPDGPKKVKDLDPVALQRGEYKEREKETTEEELKSIIKKRKAEEEREQLNKGSDSVRGGGYRYQPKSKEKKKDTASSKVQSI